MLDLPTLSTANDCVTGPPGVVSVGSVGSLSGVGAQVVTVAADVFVAGVCSALAFAAASADASFDAPVAVDAVSCFSAAVRSRSLPEPSFEPAALAVSLSMQRRGHCPSLHTSRN